MKDITFKQINLPCPLLESVLKDSIGTPTPEKLAQVLKSYELPNQCLIGAFSLKNLIAIIGFELIGSQAIIRHISVIEPLRKQGIGKVLIHYMIEKFSLRQVFLETDHESVEFYKHLGFICQSFQGKFGIRYHCILDIG